METDQCRTKVCQTNSIGVLRKNRLNFGGIGLTGRIEAIVLGTDEVAVEGLHVGVEDLRGALHLLTLGGVHEVAREGLIGVEVPTFDK